MGQIRGEWQKPGTFGYSPPPSALAIGAVEVSAACCGVNLAPDEGLGVEAFQDGNGMVLRSLAQGKSNCASTGEGVFNLLWGEPGLRIGFWGRAFAERSILGTDLR